MQDLGKYTKRTHIEIQTKYLSFLAVVSIALVALVFALGVLIGSRQSKQSTCPKLDALAVLDTRSKEPAPEAATAHPNLSFHDVLKKTASSVPTPASLQGGRNGALQPSLVAVKPPDLEPRREEDPIPESVPRDDPGIFSLQVGSFQTKQEANDMIRKLQRAGYEAFMVSVDMPDRGGVWYRVRVGPFSSKQEVWDKKKEFEDKERIPTFVVKRRAEG
jgi:cell division septation protein DedD